MVVVIGLSSCETDEETSLAQSEIDKAKEILNGDIVLSTKATMSGVDKTLVPTGCPTKFNFSWRDDNTMVIELPSFTVGTMPFSVTFRCATQFSELNSWEQEEYVGGNWIKFKGSNGAVTAGESGDSDYQEGSAASVQGYLDVANGRVVFIVEYGIMNVRTETFLQEIDKTRIDRFEEEFAQYEIDLEEAKKNQGKS